MSNFTYPDELYHFGVHGMKWGVRRYQNEDGTLTDEGRQHYAKEVSKKLNRNDRRIANAKAYKRQGRLEVSGYKSKYRRAVAKGRLDKAEKFKVRMDRANKNYRKQSRKQKRYEKENKKLVDKLIKENYDVKMSSVPRLSMTKTDKVMAIVIAAADTVFPFTAGMGAMYMATKVTPGTGYKVKSNH